MGTDGDKRNLQYEGQTIRPAEARQKHAPEKDEQPHMLQAPGTIFVLYQALCGPLSLYEGNLQRDRLHDVHNQVPIKKNK